MMCITIIPFSIFI